MNVTIQKEDSLKLKNDFNDIAMRELSLDITDDGNDYIYDMDTMEIFQIKEKFLKYSEDLVPRLRYNEMEFNLLENYRLFETIFSRFAERWGAANNAKILAISHVRIPGSMCASLVMTYKDSNDVVKAIKSDPFYNEPVRVLSLICIMKHRSHLYDLKRFDVSIVRK